MRGSLEGNPRLVVIGSMKLIDVAISISAKVSKDDPIAPLEASDGIGVVQFRQGEVSLQGGEDPPGQEEPQAQQVPLRATSHHDPHRGDHGAREQPREYPKAWSCSL